MQPQHVVDPADAARQTLVGYLSLLGRANRRLELLFGKPHKIRENPHKSTTRSLHDEVQDDDSGGGDGGGGDGGGGDNGKTTSTLHSITYAPPPPRPDFGHSKGPCRRENELLYT